MIIIFRFIESMRVAAGRTVGGNTATLYYILCLVTCAPIESTRVTAAAAGKRYNCCAELCSAVRFTVAFTMCTVVGVTGRIMSGRPP